MNEISTVCEGEKGVEVVLSGDVTVKQTLQMVEECSTGSCSCCTPTFMEQITNIDVAGQDGEVRIQVEGNVKLEELEEIEKNLSSCNKEV